MASELLASAREVRMSIFTVLMYEGSLYRQKNCLNSEPKTSLCCAPLMHSAWMCTKTV